MTALTHSHLRQTLEKQRQSLSYGDDVELEPEQRPLNVTLLKDSWRNSLPHGVNDSDCSSDELDQQEQPDRTVSCNYLNWYVNFIFGESIRSKRNLVAILIKI